MEEKWGLDEQLRLCVVKYFRRQEGSGAVTAIIVVVLALVMVNFALRARENARTIADQQAIIQEMTLRAQGLDENGVRVDRMRGYYGYDSDSENDAEFWEYCQRHYPEAIYPSTEWTAEEIIQSYYDTPEIWVYYEIRPTMGVYLTWTTDGHCFILDVESPARRRDYPEIRSGWLVIDGVRVQYLDKQTYDFEKDSLYWPQWLLVEYCQGKWDGEIRRSPDGATTAWIGANGNLEYRYQAWFYDETTDPDGLAWAGFSRERVPWWRNGIEWTATDLCQPQLEVLGEWKTDGDSVSETLYTRIYVEAPYLTDGNQFTKVRWTGDELLTLEPGVIRLYKGGEELEAWVCTGTATSRANLWEVCEEPEAEFAEDLAYFYDGETLRALRANGEMATVMDEILVHPSMLVHRIWGMSGDRLVYFADGQATVLAENVLETDFSELRLLRKEDGWYVVSAESTEPSEYEVKYWGEGKKENYLEAYELLRGGSR